MSFHLLDQEEEFQSKRALWPFMKRIFIHSYKHKKVFWMLIAASFMTAVAEGIFPLIWMQYIDNWIIPTVDAYKATGGGGWEGFGSYALLFIGVLSVEALGIAGFIFYAGRMKEYVVYDLRNEMFERLQYLSYSFYDRSAIGHLAIRLTSDVKKVAQVISWGFVSLLWGAMMIIVSMSIMFWYNWKLSVIVLLSIPILLFLAIKIRVLLLAYARKARRTYSLMAAYLTEHINGLEVNKVTVQEESASENFRTITDSLFGASYRSSLYSSLYFPAVVMTGSLAVAMVIYMGGHLTLQASAGITIGVFAAFFGYARLIFEPIFDLTRYYATAQDSLSAGERIFSLIDEEIDIKDAKGVSDFGDLKGEIEFKNVNFAYQTGPEILSGFNLKIPAGQSVAIVGTTGSGKTTLANLVGRFYEPTSGELCIDGIDFRKRTLASYRSQLGIILQTPHLFSGNLRDNLKYGQLNATDAEIQAALKLIGADGFIDRLDEEVGEEGGNLSAGEKQLISFARAILVNPKILIMDEATSSVDTLAELAIQQGIDQMIQERTAIIIAHRLSTIKNCDRILVVEQGKIIEDGSHASLIAAKGHYYDLCMKQARKA